MTTDVEQRLREELDRRARGARTSPSALEEILARSATGSRPAPPASPWRRPVVALLVAVVLVVVGVWGVVHGGDEPPPPVPPAQPLPDRPPAVEGTVVGAVARIPCQGDCTEGPAELDLANPATPRLLGDPADVGSVSQVLRDGRRVTSDHPGPGWSVVDPASGRQVSLGNDHPWSVDVLPGGRVVALAQGSGDDRPELRIVGSGGATAVGLPEDFVPFALTAGPRGWMALVGQHEDGDDYLDEAELLLIAPGGRMRRVDIEDAVEAYAWPFATGSLTLTWSDRGLIAISASELEPVEERLEHPRGWTVVVDPTTGEQVAALPDWYQGLAWSPDGTGLLAARRADADATELHLFWGPGLRHSRELGRMSLPFTPHWWTGQEVG